MKYKRRLFLDILAKLGASIAIGGGIGTTRAIRSTGRPSAAPIDSPNDIMENIKSAGRYFPFEGVNPNRTEYGDAVRYGAGLWQVTDSKKGPNLIVSMENSHTWDGSNAYHLLNGKGYCFSFDLGKDPKFGRNTLHTLSAIQMPIKEMDVVFSHNHYDHLGALRGFSEVVGDASFTGEGNLRLSVPQETYERIHEFNPTILRKMLFGAIINSLFPDEKHQQAGRWAWQRKLRFNTLDTTKFPEGQPNLKIDQDGTDKTYGDFKIRLYSKQGHCTEDVLAMFELGEKSYLAMGDHFFKDDIPLCWPGTLDAELEVLYWARDQDFDLILPGHGNLASTSDLDAPIKFWEVCGDLYTKAYTKGVERGSFAQWLTMDYHSKAFRDAHLDALPNFERQLINYDMFCMDKNRQTLDEKICVQRSAPFWLDIGAASKYADVAPYFLHKGITL